MSPWFKGLCFILPVYFGGISVISVMWKCMFWDSSVLNSQQVLFNSEIFRSVETEMWLKQLWCDVVVCSHLLQQPCETKNSLSLPWRYKVQWIPWCLGVKESTCKAGDMVGSLGREDPPEEEMATHCSTLAWRIPWTEEPGGPQSMGLQKENTT